MTAKLEQAGTENKENLDTVAAITEVLIALAISQNGGMPTHAYGKVAAFIKPLVTSTRYSNGDIIILHLELKDSLGSTWPFGIIFKWIRHGQ